MSHYPPYPAYKDSGVEWLGKIPEHWKIHKLKWLAALKSGDFITSKSIKESGSYPVYGGNGLRGYTESFTHNGDYALIGRQGALCGNINYAAGEFWASEHAVVVLPYVKTSPRWIGELLRSMNLNQYSVSAAQPGLAVERITDLYICVAPLNEQQAIAKHLDRETARIDSLITQKTRFIELLKEKRQALITQAVTKGLDPHVKMKDSGVEWLGEVPEHWDIKRLRYVAKLNPSMRIDLLDTDEVSFLPMDAIGENGSIEIDRIRLVGDIKSGYSYFENNDVVFAKVTPCFENGKGAIMRGLNNGTGFGTTEITVLRPKKNILTAYINLIVRCSSFKAFGEGSMTGAGGLKRVPDEFTRNYLIPLPCLDEQQKISEFIATNSSRIDRLIAQSNHSITLLKERRSALITAAVTGQIDLREAA